jgi:mono/diheme cytochrome c family protein
MRNGATKTYAKPALAVLALSLAACRQDMHDQPRYKPLAYSTFYDNHSSARPIPEGTVARGPLRVNQVFYTGRQGDDNLVSEIPVPVTKELLERGESRFNIYCTPCHSRLGDGEGMVVQRGFAEPPSYHIDRLRDAPIGHYFDVMTNGFGAMHSYASRVEPKDRWAIAAYIRALQLSQNAQVSDLPPEQREELMRSK